MSLIIRGKTVERTDLEERLDLLVDEHRAASGVDWLNVVAVLAGRVSTYTPNEDVDFVDRYGAEAHVQFLLAVCSDLQFDPDVMPPDNKITSVATFAHEAFELARALIHVGSPGDDYASSTTRHLQMEMMEDRFEFYSRHARTMKAAILDPLADRLESTLGWTIDDYWSVGDAAARIANDRRVGERARFVKDDPLLLDRLSEIGPHALRNELDAKLSIHSIDELSARAGLPEKRVEAILEALRLPADGTLAVRSPRDDSPIRTHCVLPVGIKYFIPFPQLWPQETFRLVERIAAGPLRAAWLRARDDGTEEIVASRLERIFQPANVLRAAEHVAGDADGETDVLVVLGDDALLVECKAHSLTPAGRRGAPARIESKTGEILEKAFDQVRKGRAHLMRGGVFRGRDRVEQVINVEASASLLSLVVSFERIDPIFMRTSLHDFETDRALAIGLPDFLTLTDLVTWPSAFMYYLRERTALLSITNLSAATEQDFVGMFLEDQTISAISSAAPDVDVIWVDGYGPSLNPLLAVAESKFEPPELPYPPSQLLAAMYDVLSEAPPGWLKVAFALHEVDRRKWRQFKQLIRRLPRTVQRNEKSRGWQDGNLSVELRTDDGPTVVFASPDNTIRLSRTTAKRSSRTPVSPSR